MTSANTKFKFFTWFMIFFKNNWLKVIFLILVIGFVVCGFHVQGGGFSCDKKPLPIRNIPQAGVPAVYP